MKFIKQLAIFLIAVLATSCIDTQKVDLIIHNARITTMDDVSSKAEAVAVLNGKIVAVGAENEILNKYTASDKIDARKQHLYPGFIDAHSHLLSYGLELNRLNLIGTKSFDEILERISDYIAKNDSKWVIGRGWDQNDWTDHRFPVNDTLQILFPDHYIALKRVDGHAYLVSENLLKLAGIDEHTSVIGGQILLDEEGYTNGILLDEAMKLISSVLPTPDSTDKLNAIRKAQDHLLQVGLTTVCDAGLSPEEVQLIHKAHDSFLKIRVYAMYAADSAIRSNLNEYQFHTDRLDAQAIKVYGDGALGSRGALLKAPYSDQHDQIGFLITSEEELMEWAKACKKSQFQLNVHCIGDSANKLVLKTMASVLGGTNDKRWRIEHAQVVSPEDRALFGNANIIPSMQPTHATSDMYWAEDRLGTERIEHAYSLRSLMNQNGLIALGTDFPVEGINPINTLFSACVRRDAVGFPEQGFNFKERLSREDALRGITIWAAIANFEDQNRGSIEPGKFADMVLMDQDLINCSNELLLSAKVLRTWINGETVFEK